MNKESKITIKGVIDLLNDTQTTILSMVVEGKTNEEIAKYLHYSIRNIKYHLEKIYTHFKISKKKPQNRRAMLIKEVTKRELEKYI